jgi:hypothetical protein
MHLSHKKLSILAKELIKKRPDVAVQLLIDINEQNRALINDTSLIKYYFDCFCDLTEQDKEELVTIKNKYQILERKRQFCGLVLKLYQPAAFDKGQQYFQPQKGLIINLANTLNADKGNVSKMLHEVLTHVRAYKDFRASIEYLYQQIIPTDKPWH